MRSWVTFRAVLFVWRIKSKVIYDWALKKCPPLWKYIKKPNSGRITWLLRSEGHHTRTWRLRTTRYGSTLTSCIFLLSQPLSRTVWTAEKLPSVPERLSTMTLQSYRDLITWYQALCAVRVRTELVNPDLGLDVWAPRANQ